MFRPAKRWPISCCLDTAVVSAAQALAMSGGEDGGVIVTEIWLLPPRWLTLLLETGEMFPLCSWVLLSKQNPESVGGPRQAGGLPSGRAKREQAELQLVLGKRIEKGGGGWPRNSRIRKLVPNFKWSWRRENIPLFLLGLILRSLLHLHLTLKSSEN